MRTIIRQLLDDTHFYSRAEWSRFLGISESAIDIWTKTDAMIPRADLLHMVIDLLQTRGGSSARPALTTLDEAIQADPDLRAYYGAASLGDLGRSLRDEPRHEQIAILRDRRVRTPGGDPSSKDRLRE